MLRKEIIAIQLRATAIMLVIMTLNACGGAVKSSIKVQLAQGASNEPAITAADPANPKAGDIVSLTGKRFPTRASNLVARVVLADSGTKDSTLTVTNETNASFTVQPDTASEIKTILMMRDGKTLARFDIVPAAVATIDALTFSPAAGSYGGTQSVTITSSQPGVTIYYTIDGSTPTTTSAIYTSAILVSSTQTIKALASKSKFTDSEVGEAAYVINGAAATPTAVVTAGTCGAADTVTLSSSTSGSVVHYTTGNGTQAAPTCSSSTGTISLTATTTVKAIACKAEYSDSAVAIFAYTVEAQDGQFCGGTGASGTPYRICSLDTLANIASNLDDSFIVTRDIDASSTATSNSGVGWGAIGTSGAPFTGTLDGQDHFICGLKINAPSTDYIGLFGVASATSTIKNIKFTDAGIVGRNYVGSVAGTISGVIQNVAVQGSVQGTDHVGGVVGNLTSATGSMVNSNANSIAVSGTTDIGGVAGLIDSGATITSSWSSGTVTGDATTGAKVGGLVGSIGVSTISRSYSSAEVSANNRIGGLVGNVSGLNTELCTIEYSHASGNVTAVGANPAVAGGAGGLVGYGVGCPRVKKSYATGNVTSPHTSSNNYVGGLVGSILPSSSYTTNATNVEDSYATGTVTSASVAGRVGGLMGWSQGEIIVRSYASGAVNAPAAMAGGLCGNCRQIHNSFSTGVVSGTAGALNGTTGPYRAGFVGLKYSTVFNAFWLKPAGSPLACYGYNDWDPANPTPCSEVSDQIFFSTAGGTLFSQWDFTADTGVWYLPGSGALPRLRE